MIGTAQKIDSVCEDQALLKIFPEQHMQNKNATKTPETTCTKLDLVKLGQRALLRREDGFDLSMLDFVRAEEKLNCSVQLAGAGYRVRSRPYSSCCSPRCED